MIPGFAPLLPSLVDLPTMTLTSGTSGVYETNTVTKSTAEQTGFHEGQFGLLSNRQLTSSVRVFKLQRIVHRNGDGTLSSDTIEVGIAGPTDAILSSFLSSFPWFKQRSPTERASVSSTTDGGYSGLNAERTYVVTKTTNIAPYAVDDNGTYQYRRKA